MRRLLPIVLIFVGLGGGLVAGVMSKPDAGLSVPDGKSVSSAAGEVATTDSTVDGDGKTRAIPDPGTIDSATEESDDSEPKERSYVMIGKQTIVPVVEGQKTRALMLFELAVDIESSAHDLAVLLEPRLRDAFLRELLRMSSTGAFTKTYTEDWVIDEMRRNLSQAARQYLGDSLKEVLILDVIRQEM